MLAAAAQAQTPAPQGLYSADDIMDAGVYLQGESRNEIGDVEDILLDDNMQVQALVIDAENSSAIGGRDVVINNDQYRLETDNEGGDDIDHRVIIDLSEEEARELPTYDRDWWHHARASAAQAWQETREGAESAWQRTQEGAADVMETINERINEIRNDG
ncbi:PRC-barrel domain containing protein [Aidingimonas lacisalsi]|uniref:PRC-barrel domain containing protein n=1 Tax=Aidingimonas lacisalsi TaxID=2604086 RepID=UPI0011D22686|nr:PRC-barrel domain containing protein [Aidingimonas lacisalsi]